MERGDDYSFHGNTVSGGVINHGKDVRNYYGTGDDTSELTRSIDELQLRITQYAAALPDPGQLRELTEALSGQLRQGQPNRTVLRSLLDSLTAGAGGVSAVVTAVSGVAALVSRLFP
ncbi:DUF5955 family protein [Streptomyces sp. NPDC046909]|uniref:DUF5955 family protein n=1 Tax=Streptomyces sp. NPDC046909 TaxID=3155617 RepID=UPI003407B723